MTLAYLTTQYSAQYAESPPPQGFPSRGEEVVFWELKRRAIPFVYQWRPGDIEFTAAREERSADFAIPANRIILNPTSFFTHPSPELDALDRKLFEQLGYETYFLPDYQILPEMGGDVSEVLDRIPGLAFIGQGYSGRHRTTTKNTFGQPPRDKTFGRFNRGFAA